MTAQTNIRTPAHNAVIERRGETSRDSDMSSTSTAWMTKYADQTSFATASIGVGPPGALRVTTNPTAATTPVMMRPTRTMGSTDAMTSDVSLPAVRAAIPKIARLPAVAMTILAFAGCARPATAPRAGDRIPDLVPAKLLRQANRGREIFGPDGFFRLPASVRRIWIDVGAHRLQTTRDELRYPDVAIVAIEPMEEAWSHWPDSDRVLGLPVAIYLDRGVMDFHVNRIDQASSLLEEAEGSQYTKTIEVRKVPVIRLEDVINAIPARYSVSYVKTDVQGVDLQVLQSGGAGLRRAERVRAEIIHSPEYKKLNGQGMSTDKEMAAYMEGQGFLLENQTSMVAGFLDASFVNIHRSPFDRVWQDFRFGVPNP